MLKILGLACTLLLCAAGRVWPQGTEVANLKTSLAPASPEAATLFKFQDIPVGKYTGTANISIPLVSVSENGFNFPVTLSYHSSGIKVNEMPSYTGLGWKLDAGGMVSRKVRDFPDDHPQGYMLRTDWYNTVYEPLLLSSDLPAYTATAGRLVDGNNREDTEPDEFYFSFNGYSGKMSFQHSAANTPAKLVVSSPVPLKVTYTQSGGKITAWQIVTPDALLYTFSVMESTRTESTPINLCNALDARSEYVSSWYLSSITGVNGFDNVNVQFTYDDYHVDYEWMVALSETHSAYAPNGCYRPIPNQSPSLSTSRSRMYLKGKKIKQVYFPGSKTTILFQYINNRQDMSAFLNNKTLDEVIVQQDDGYASTNKKQLDKVVMKYFYRGNRLMLESVQRVGNDNITTTPPYEFTYNNAELPERNGGPLGRHQIDHWGYYNGSNGLLPKYEELTNGNFFYYPVSGSSNKNPNLAYTKAQSLEKITYPTGGSTNLQYELNSYGFIQNLPLTERQLFLLKDTGAGTRVTGVNQFYNESSISFTVPPGGLELQFIVSASIAACYTGDLGQTFCQSRNFPIGKLYLESSPGNLELIKEIHTTLENQYHSWYLPTSLYGPGNYVIKTYAAKRPGPDPNASDNCNATLYWKMPEVQNIIADWPAGGLRVKQVIDHDPVANVSKVRRFNYDMLVNGRTQSAGVIYAEPKYLYVNHSIVSFTDPNTGLEIVGNCVSETITGSSSIQTAETGGSHIGYRQVTEWEEYEGAPNGKTISYFTSPYEYPDMINDEKPFAAPVSQAYKTGLAQSEEVYDNQNRLLKKDSFNYVFFEHLIPSIKVSKGLLECPCPGSGPVGSPCSAAHFYSDMDGDGENDLYARFMGTQRLGYARIAKEMHLQDGFTSEKLYVYDNSLQLLKKVTERTGPADKDSVVITYKHPGDEGSIPGLTAEELQAIAAMKNKGMLTSVLEETTTKRNTHILTLRNHYKNFDAAVQMKTALSGVSVKFASAALEKRYDIEQYDQQGRIVQQRKTNDFPYSYIWDALNGSVTAEVSNAVYGNIAYIGFESEDAPGSGWVFGVSVNYARNATDAFSGKYSYSLTNGSISKTGLTSGYRYIISYWSKNGAYNVNGIAAVAGKTNAAGWTYYEHTTGTTTISVTVSGTGLIDELRLYPAQAQMVTYTYETGNALLGKNLMNNTITHFEYDAMNRLKIQRDHDRNIIQLLDYQFRKPERDITPQWNDVLPLEQRCETGADLGATNNYNTGYQVKKQTDINPYSNTYNQVRWVRTVQNNTVCPVTDDWQFLRFDCGRDGCGNYTGVQVRVEQNRNPYSATYNQTREIPLGANTSACPLPPACTSEGFRTINNLCEPGIKVVTQTEIVECNRVETYHYRFSCGPVSQTYTRWFPIPGCIPQ